MGESHQPITFAASDGHILKADRFSPEGKPIGAVIVAPAMAVPSRLYHAFAVHLAKNGFEALIPTYRGLGRELKESAELGETRLVDWGEKDLQSAVDHLMELVPGVPLHWVGHSVGGQLFGLLDPKPFSRVIFIASQSGHWRLWDGIRKPTMLAVWHLIPIVTRVFGKLPMRRLRMGEDVAAGVANQWAEWGRDRRYILKYAEERGDIFTFDGAIRSYALSDDSYAPARSVEKLLEAYKFADTEFVRVEPRMWNAHKVGHFGMFRSRFRYTFWKEVTDYLGGDSTDNTGESS